MQTWPKSRLGWNLQLLCAVWALNMAVVAALTFFWPARIQFVLDTFRIRTDAFLFLPSVVVTYFVFMKYLAKLRVIRQ